MAVEEGTMVLLFDKLHDGYLGYAGIFGCISIGFLCLRGINRSDDGSVYWSLGFLLNCLGFVFWSGAVPVAPSLYYLLGEMFHIAGFLLLVAGAHRFTGRAFERGHVQILAAWIALWIVSILLFKEHTVLAGFMLKALRSLIFASTGISLLLEGRKQETEGIRVAGISLLAWGIYILAFAFIKINANLYYGLLVGLQVLSAFGMVAMLMDRVRMRAEKSERRVASLEGILPICAYCKKIRDEDNQWNSLEAYIEARSTAEFSHGICPDCFGKFRPDR
jgi:hypothetical protein